MWVTSFQLRPYQLDILFKPKIYLEMLLDNLECGRNDQLKTQTESEFITGTENDPGLYNFCIKTMLDVVSATIHYFTLN